MTSETEQLWAQSVCIVALRVILTDLVACVKDDLQRLPEGYRGREALERALRILKELPDE